MTSSLRIRARTLAPIRFLAAFAWLAGALVATDAAAATLCLTDQIGVRLGDAPFLCGRADGSSFSPLGNGTNSTSAGMEFVSDSPGEVDIQTTAPGGITAWASGQAEFGRLRAFAQGELGDWTDPADGTAEANALAEVSFGDRLTITSSTLAVGTPVDISVIVSVDGVFGATCCGGLVRATVSAPGFFVDRMNVLVNALSPTYDETFSITTATVGDVLYLRLGIRAQAGAISSPIPNSGFADMLSTGEVFVVVNTPGASFVSDSHATYAVPEPGAAALLLLGALVGVGRRGRR